MGISVQKTNAAILYQSPVMLWFLCALSYFATSADGVKSTCSAGSVQMGEETRIICRFEEDISKTQHDVRLFYNTTPVLVIAWSNGSPEIHTKHGYQFDGKINDTVTLEIAEAKLDQAGLYACHIVLSDANDASPCMLNVTGALYTTTATDACPAICSTSSSFNQNTSNENSCSMNTIVVAIVFGIVCFTTIFTVICLRLKWLPRCGLDYTKRSMQRNVKTDNIRNLDEGTIEMDTLDKSLRTYEDDCTVSTRGDFIPDRSSPILGSIYKECHFVNYKESG